MPTISSLLHQFFNDMKYIKYILVVSLLGVHFPVLFAQPLKPRPDAFPPVAENYGAKAVQMAATVEEMSGWDRYPTYETYVAMMQGWAEQYPTLCRLDTIGTSVNGRLILCMIIKGEESSQSQRPEFFYSSTMHGDEVTGYVMMLRLIDTLLSGYGSNQQYTDLINSVDIYINPLANPDGTYRRGNSTVQGSVRYNANNVDLNRNYPDPFGTAPLNPQQQENTAMIDYFTNHHFRLSANLHGGSEVMNYPWDSFTSRQRPHPDRDWWIEVSRRFVDTSRMYSRSCFRDVTTEGYIEGGDWYVISNGRQDYVNYYHDCREMTMEISSVKTLSSDQLPAYWRFLQHSFVNYIGEIFTFYTPDDPVGIDAVGSKAITMQVFPNPAGDRAFLREPMPMESVLYDMKGMEVQRIPAGQKLIDLTTLPSGLYLLRCGTATTKLIRQ